jgi:hypothetical protein
MYAENERSRLASFAAILFDPLLAQDSEPSAEIEEVVVRAKPLYQ